MGIRTSGGLPQIEGTAKPEADINFDELMQIVEDSQEDDNLSILSEDHERRYMDMPSDFSFSDDGIGGGGLSDGSDSDVFGHLETERNMAPES